MNTCFLPIKRKIQILVIALNFVTFIIIASLTNEKKDNYLEYTTLPKYCSNVYIFIIFLIILIHSIYPKLICKFLSDNLGILICDRGKLIINLSIGILYWSSNNNAQLIFSIINFVSSFALFLCEFIFQCNILNNIRFDSDNNEEKYNIDNYNDDSNNNVENKEYDINNKIINREKGDTKESIISLDEH